MASGIPYLSILTFLPIIGMIGIAFLKKDQITMIRSVAVGVTAIQLVVAIIVWMNYNNGMVGVNHAESFQFIERMPWIRLAGLGIFGNIAIDYYMGIDGLSVTMVLL